MTTTYKVAIEKNNAAIAAFHVVRNAYRAQTIGDAQFLAARKAYYEAMDEFDAAYTAEAITLAKGGK